MLCKRKDSNADKHYEGAEDHRILEGMEDLLTGTALIHQAFGDEDGVVVAHTKDECGQNNVHYVETEAGEPHDAFNPYPAHSQRKECHNGQRETLETQDKEQEYNNRAHKADSIEILIQGLYKTGLWLRGCGFVQGIEERLESVGCESVPQARSNKGV